MQKYKCYEKQQNMKSLTPPFILESLFGLDVPPPKRLLKSKV